jgi:hypothetical protein
MCMALVLSEHPESCSSDQSTALRFACWAGYESGTMVLWDCDPEPSVLSEHQMLPEAIMSISVGSNLTGATGSCLFLDEYPACLGESCHRKISNFEERECAHARAGGREGRREGGTGSIQELPFEYFLGNHPFRPCSGQYQPFCQVAHEHGGSWSSTF